jgi:HSP20 family protein
MTPAWWCVVSGRCRRFSSGAAIHRLEIPYGRFERRIPLPPGNYRLHEQFLEDGCLVLVLRHLQ